jgi:hypothetical protein
MARTLLILRITGEVILLMTALAVTIWGVAIVQILMTGDLR